MNTSKIKTMKKRYFKWSRKERSEIISLNIRHLSYDIEWEGLTRHVGVDVGMGVCGCVCVCVCVCVGVKGVYPTKSWMEGYRICKMLNQRELKRIFTEVCAGWTGFPSSSVVKNLPAVQEMQVWSLGQEDPLEEEMANHPSILSWTEKPCGLPSMGSQRVRQPEPQ